MSRAGLDGVFHQDTSVSAMDSEIGRRTRESLVTDANDSHGGTAGIGRGARERSTQRESLIVVLPENHVVSAELVSERLSFVGDQETVDVIVACPAQPPNLAGLQRKVRDLQVLLAPAGTSTEDLRELAMRRAAGDIVTLLSGAPY